MKPRSLTRFGLSSRTILRNPAATVMLVILAAMIGFGIGATPRFVNQKADEALSRAAADASIRQKNISFAQYRRISSDNDDVFLNVREAGSELQSTIGGALGEATTPASTLIDSPMFEVRDFPIDPGIRLDRWFTFRALDGHDDEITLVEGTLPAPAGDIEIVTGPCDQSEGDPAGPTDPEQEEEEEIDPGCVPVNLRLFQTAITAETADLFRLGIGDRVLLRGSEDIPNNRALPRAGLDYQAVLEVSGIVELSDVQNETWMGDGLLHFPARVSVGFTEFDTFAGGLLSPDDYDRLMGTVLPSRFLYHWNFAVDYEQINSANAEEVLADQTSLQLQYAGADGVFNPVLFSGIDGIIESYQGERRTTVALTSLIVVGVAGIALATVLVVAALAAKRREATTVLIRGRGGEPGRLALSRYVEGMVIFIPSVTLGIWLAALTIAGRSGSSVPLWALTTALTLAIVYTLMAIPATAGNIGRLLSGAPVRHNSGRRIVIEVALIGLAVASTLLLQRRGLDVGASFDPLLAAVPLLMSIAVSVVLLRLVPISARVATAISGRARGVVSMIGFRSLSRRSLAAQFPPVVALIGVTVAVFGVVLMTTISDTQEKGSWQAVGANYRLEPFNPTSTVSPQLDVTDVPGVERTAGAVAHIGGLYENGVSRGSIDILAADLVDYQAVGADTDADPHLPDSLLPETLIDIGTESNPIPAIASSTWSGRELRPGEILSLSIDLTPIVVVVEEVRETFPGLSPDREFSIISREALGATGRLIPIQPNRLFVRGTDAASAALSQSVREQQPGLRFISRPDLLQDIRDRPSVAAVQRVAVISYIVSATLAAVAVVSGFALTASERRRDMGYLRAIGLSAGQMSRATIIEQIPPALTAAVLGIVTGLGLWLMISESIDFVPLTGTTINYGTTVSWPTVLGIAAFVVGTVLVATAIYSYVNREMDLANVLRRGERT